MRLIVLILIAAPVFAQSASALPESWVGAGATYDTRAAGYLTYAKLLSQSQQAYSYSTYQVSRAGGKITTTTDTGAALVLRHWSLGSLGAVYTLAFGTAGLGASTTAHMSLSAGGVGLWRIAKSDWTFQVSARAQRIGTISVNVYSAGFGRVFAKGL